MENTVSETNKTVTVEIPRQQSFCYSIIIGKNILDNAGKYIKQYSKAEKILLVSNEKVNKLYGEKLKSSILAENFKINTVILPDGEKYKDTHSLELIWQKAVDFQIERKDAVVALGGGVVGDISGFAASTYLRGVDFIQIPTTLLAQVDSSVGGKVAINHKSGKNLLGSFYQPKLVLTDVSTLATLTVDELKVGLAEVIKYAFIEKSCGLGSNNYLIDYLMKNKDLIFALDKSIIEELIKYCCELKAAVVNADEKESGLRAILNFGHTIGHAIEKCSNYEKINHGNAVAIGMKGALYISKAKKLIDENYYKKCIELLNICEMNYKTPESLDSEAIYEAMFGDKKVISGKIRFVLSTGVAEVDIFNDIDKETALESIKTLY